MKIKPRYSVSATYWGLWIIWGCGGIGVLLITGKAILAVLYLVTLGPILILIYHTTKAELYHQLSRKKEDKKDAAEPAPADCVLHDDKPE